MNSHKPFIIGIGGAHSSVGKTTLAAAVIRYLTTHPARYPFGNVPKLGAIKYTNTPLYASLIDDESIINQNGKDTSKLSEAGAIRVLWIKSPRTDVEEIVPVALARLADLDGIVIEGNIAIEFAEPDIVIFITGHGPEKGIKPSSEMLLNKADIVIVPGATAPVVPKAGAKIYAPGCCPYIFDNEAIQDIITLMEEITKKKEIEHLLRERAVDSRLTCTEARIIAEELKVPYCDIGQAANELKIKIRNCELGCF